MIEHDISHLHMYRDPGSINHFSPPKSLGFSHHGSSVVQVKRACLGQINSYILLRLRQLLQITFEEIQF